MPGIDAISQILNLVPSILQGIIGGTQLSKANRLERENIRPEAQIAPSVNKLVNYSYGRTLAQDIAGGDIARNEIKGATAAGLRAASEMGGGAEAYGLLGELVGRQQNQFANIAKETAQQNYQAGGDYMNALTTKANEENRVWEWNKADPYLSAAAIAQKLGETGWQNISSGAKNVFGATAEAINPDFNSSLLLGGSNQKGLENISMDELVGIIKSIKGS